MDTVKDKIPSNVKDAISENINMINKNTQKYREIFMNFIKENKVIVAMVFLAIIASLVSYRFTPKPREWIVKRTISKHIQNQAGIKSVYKLLEEYGAAKAPDYYITNDFWEGTNDINDAKELWFTLSDFHIASSSKTYLLLSKYYDYCSYDSITYTLDAGARFIELDIFRQGLNEDQNIPVVTNGIEVGEWKMCINTLCLDKCMKIINDLAFNTNNSEANNNPLILYLNININAELLPVENENGTYIKEKYGDYRFYNKIAQIIYDNIQSDNLLDASYSWYNQIKQKQMSNIHLENIKRLRKKLIIMSNVSANCSNLAEFINIVCPQNIKNNAYIDNISSYTNIELDSVYDIKSLRKKNKNHLTYVYEKSENNNLQNYVSGTAFENGCQLISMYYQVNDNNLYNYLNNKWGKIKENEYSFNECSFLLKRKNLRNTYGELVDYTVFKKITDNSQQS